MAFLVCGIRMKEKRENLSATNLNGSGHVTLSSLWVLHSFNPILTSPFVS